MYPIPQIPPKGKEQRAYPRKKACVYKRQGTHYFLAFQPGQLYCCRRCEKNDEYPD